jgi:hypothetical protein
LPLHPPSPVADGVLESVEGRVDRLERGKSGKLEGWSSGVWKIETQHSIAKGAMEESRMKCLEKQIVKQKKGKKIC